MHIYKSRFLVRGEVWFDGLPDKSPVDWILHRQRSQAIPNARSRGYHTLLLDLSQPTETLQQQVRDSTAYKIRRARDKDKVSCESHRPVSREMLDCFEEVYNRFASLKRLPSLDRPSLDLLAADGALEISVVKDPGGKALAYHVYYCSSERSCLLHAASLYQLLSDSSSRNAMGRANRYLFWDDVLRHKQRGLKRFDFGGWYPGTTNQELLDINRFKEGYGGRVVREFNCEQIVSPKAWALLTAAALLDRAKDLKSKLRFSQRLAKSEAPAARPKVDSGHRFPVAESLAPRETELAG
jgi:hypothetical protein